MKFFSKSAEKTRQIAAKLAKRILSGKRHKDHAIVVALSGDLGAGKTTFAQGFGKALKIKRRVVSPTFIIFRNYLLKSITFKSLYHFDLYRIQENKELSILGFQKILSEPSNIILIEWAEKVKKVLPKDAIRVEFSYGRKKTERIITYRR